jgi:dipeptidyl aminopeptidase/acylaminoacyl peptidase
LVEAYFDAAENPVALREVAPIYHLDGISAPVQIHIGKEDGQRRGYTPPEWSEKLYNALLIAQKEVEYYSYAGEEHFFTDTSWIQMMQRSLTFYQTAFDG